MICLELFSTLKNVTIVKSLPTFCPKNKCIIFDENGALLYNDSDHLSPNGSKFQVKNLLIKYLNVMPEVIKIVICLFKPTN